MQQQFAGRLKNAGRCRGATPTRRAGDGSRVDGAAERRELIGIATERIETHVARSWEVPVAEGLEACM